MDLNLKIKSLFNPILFTRIGVPATSSEHFKQSISFQKMQKSISKRSIHVTSINDHFSHIIHGRPINTMPSEFCQVVDFVLESESFLASDHSKVLLFKYLLDPIVSKGKKNQRVRYRPTEFKTLNAMYQLNKNIANGRWTAFACGKKRIGNAAKRVGRKSVTKFITGDGLTFFKKNLRFKTVSIYELHEWVIEIFKFFEKKGMLRGIMQDFEKWRKIFLKRLNKWLLPLLEKGHTLKDLLVNKLSTEKPLKGAHHIPLKGAGIKPTENIKPTGFKTNIVLAAPVREAQETWQALDRLHIGEVDARHFMFKNPLGILNRAAHTLAGWMQSGTRINSPVRALQSIIAKQRRAA